MGLPENKAESASVDEVQQRDEKIARTLVPGAALLEVLKDGTIDFNRVSLSQIGQQAAALAIQNSVQAQQADNMIADAALSLLVARIVSTLTPSAPAGGGKSDD